MSDKLQDQRIKLVADQRQLIKKADDESRGMTVDEMATFDKIDADIVSLKATIDRSESVAAAERRATEQRIEMAEPVETRTPATMSLPVAESNEQRTSSEYRSGFERYMRGGQLNDAENRALSEGTNTAGGFLVPDQWYTRIIEKLNEENIMRRLSTVITTEHGTFNIPVVNTVGAANWTAEGAALTESDTVFANYTMSAYKAARIMKVSRELIADNTFDLESYITSEFTTSINTLCEAAYIDGDASSKPKGVIYDATVTAFAGAAAITADELIGLYHELKPQYRVRPSTAWIMADATIKAVRLLKDTTNQYVWQPGLRDGDPDRLLGKPVYASSHMPAMTTAKKSVLFGDYSYFFIGDRSGIEMQRLYELYAASGQDAFIGTFRTDSVLTNTEDVQVGQQA